MHNVLTILITRNRWFNARPVRTGLMVPVPPLKGDPWRCSTVLPYLEAYHYQHDRDTQAVYFTEHDMNRKIISVLCKPCCAVLLNHLVRRSAEELAKHAAEMAAQIRSASHSFTCDQNTLHQPNTSSSSHNASSSHSHNCSSASSHKKDSSSSTSFRKRARKSVSCISVSKLTSCRPS